MSESRHEGLDDGLEGADDGEGAPASGPAEGTGPPPAGRQGPSRCAVCIVERPFS